MAQRETKLERLAEGRFPYWVALIEEKCTGANYEKIAISARGMVCVVAVYSRRRYEAAQHDAERAGRGIWSGSYVEPWLFWCPV
jgi:hypothetical protein